MICKIIRAVSLSAALVIPLLNGQAQSGASCSSAINIALSTSNSDCLSNSISSNTNNIWYKFTALRSITNFEITYDPLGSGTIEGVHVFTGNCNSPIELGATVDQHDNSLKVFLSILSAGQTYYIRLDKNTPGATATFTMCSSPAEQVPYQISGTDVNFGGSVKVDNNLNIAGTTTFNGSMINATFSGGDSRILYTDGTGTILPLQSGSKTQVLYGSGVWGDLPTFQDLWTDLDGGVNYNGYVGINNESPKSALDVIGDGKISGNLNVGSSITLDGKGAGISYGATAQTNVAPGILTLNAATKINGALTVGDVLNIPKQLTFDGNQAGLSYFANYVPALEPLPGTLALTANTRICGNLSTSGNAGIVGTLTTGSFVTNSVTLTDPNSSKQAAISAVAGHELSPATIVLGSNSQVNGSLNVSGLAGGAGLTEVYVDESGNLKTINPINYNVLLCAQNSLNWNIGGNMIGPYMNYSPTPAAGTCDNYDFVLKAYGNPYVWLKRMVNWV